VPAAIPSAEIDDLDLDSEDGEREWQHQLMALTTTRIEAAHARLEHLGVIDGQGSLVTKELRADMQADSDTTVETG
jgi:hypothetical protein